MYNLYLENHEQDILEKLKNGDKVKPIVKYEFFTKYFNTNFNLSFGNPKSDTCQTYDRLQNLINAELDQEIKLSFLEEKVMHKKKAEIFYSYLKKLSLETKDNSFKKILCYILLYEIKKKRNPVIILLLTLPNIRLCFVIIILLS